MKTNTSRILEESAEQRAVQGEVRAERRGNVLARDSSCSGNGSAPYCSTVNEVVHLGDREASPPARMIPLPSVIALLIYWRRDHLAVEDDREEVADVAGRPLREELRGVPSA